MVCLVSGTVVRHEAVACIIIIGNERERVSAKARRGSRTLAATATPYYLDGVVDDYRYCELSLRVLRAVKHDSEDGDGHRLPHHAAACQPLRKA